MGSLAAVLVAAILIVSGATPAPVASSLAPPTIGARTSAPSPPPSLPSTLLAYPTGATDVILSLRIESSGAEPTTASMRALHQETVFAMYGDGTVIFDVPIVRRGGYPRPEDLGLFTVHLDDEQVVALLQYALDPGGLRDATTSYSMAVEPRTDAVLTIDAFGVIREVTVTAPGAVDPSLSPVAGAIRSRLGSLVSYLQSFGGSSIVQSIGLASPYRADRYLAVLDDQRSIELSPPLPGRVVPSPWPWPDLPPAAFHTGATLARTLVITPEQYDTLLALPTAYGEGIAVRGPDGNAYVITARPLLADERLP